MLTCLRKEYERIGARYLAELGGRGARLLDFGCGNTPYRPLLAGYVAEYVGCDLAGNPFADCTLERPDRLPFPDGWASVVLSSQVLEHAVDPTLYLAECARVLPPGGLLVLSTHGVWRYHPDPLDLWRWTGQGLRHIVESADFDVIDFRGVGGPVATGLQLVQDAAQDMVWRPLRGLFTVCVQLAMQAGDRFTAPDIRNRDAAIYVLVARRRPGEGVGQ